MENILYTRTEKGLCLQKALVGDGLPYAPHVINEHIFVVIH